MHYFSFSDSPQQRHRVLQQPERGVVQVDNVDVDVIAQSDGLGGLTARLAGRSERLHAHAHGDAVYVQWRGRAWRIDRIDPTRSAHDSNAAGAGSLLAPMPGVVVSCQVTINQSVHVGDSLLVIESMKLQTTISASADGIVAQLPLTIGQTFERGALLARIASEQVAS